MSILVDREEFSKALNSAAGIARNQRVLEILMYSLLDIQEDKIWVYGCDGANQIILPVNIKSDIGPCKYLVPVKVIANTVSLYKSEELKLTPKCSRLQISSGRSRQNLLCAANVDQYPIFRLDSEDFSEFDVGLLVEALSSVSYIASEADIREDLQTIGFEFGDSGLRFYVSDSFRASSSTVEGNVPEAMLGVKFLISDVSANAVLSFLKKSNEQVRVAVQDNLVSFSTSIIKLFCRQPHVDYPFEGLASILSMKESLASARFAKDRLESALLRCNVVTSLANTGVDVVISDNIITLEKQSPQFGDVFEEISGKATLASSFRANIGHFLSAISHCPGEYVIIWYGDTSNSIFVTPEESLNSGYICGVAKMIST